MEKIKSICVMCDLLKALTLFEERLNDAYGISLNEAMVMCSIGAGHIAAGTISERTGLSPSHTSKVIRSAEEKGLLVRNFGDEDKRKMYFVLSDKAKDTLRNIRAKGVEIPETLRPIFDAKSDDDYPSELI